MEEQPNELREIKQLRSDGPRILWEKFDEGVYREKLEGSLLGRLAGCTLGAPVELWPIEKMESLAVENGDRFPPTDYWSTVPDPLKLRYEFSTRESYTRDKLNGVPVDDDIVYTLLGLLIAESHGVNFTTDNVGESWLRYLPYACTAEEITLKNLKDGHSAMKAAEIDNPYDELIGADIRSDPWGYMAPGWPEFAAEMAYRDAYISHRKNGIYGEMFFSAAISAAFTVDDPLDALKIGLSEIPKDCELANAINWAFEIAPKITNYQEARNAVDEKFEGMHRVHTINNACLTLWGIKIGGTDITRVIGETVAMGLDNDCTAATAGSIVGAVVGKSGVPEHWYRNFNDTIHSYLIDRPSFSITDVLDRFNNQASQCLQ